jgi:hypothetical protein
VNHEELEEEAKRGKRKEKTTTTTTMQNWERRTMSRIHGKWEKRKSGKTC